MEANPIAVCTFFSKTTCGYCKQFKGESTDSSGATKIDPNSGWETLTSDLDLQNMGIVFKLYQFGPEKDSRTGKVLNYVLEAPYSDQGRIRGVPHLELSIPDQPDQFVPFDPSGLTGWEASKSVPLMKKWIMQALQKDPFKSYAADIRSGKMPKSRQAAPANLPAPAREAEGSQHVQAPQPARDGGVFRAAPPVDQSSSQRVAQVQAQQREYQRSSRPEHGDQSQQVHASHQHHDASHFREQPRREVQQRNAPTTFGMGTRQVRPVVTPNTVPVSPARQAAVASVTPKARTQAQTPQVIEKPRPRFVPANYDE